VTHYQATPKVSHVTSFPFSGITHFRMQRDLLRSQLLTVTRDGTAVRSCRRFICVVGAHCGCAGTATTRSWTAEARTVEHPLFVRLLYFSVVVLADTDSACAGTATMRKQGPWSTQLSTVSRDVGHRTHPHARSGNQTRTQDQTRRSRLSIFRDCLYPVLQQHCPPRHVTRHDKELAP
jgi:hypothetical protein